MAGTGSTLVRRQLGRRLRKLREAAGKTAADVAAARIMQNTKLWRLETGKIPVRVADVRTLCWLYGADEATTDQLASLALGSDGEGWWEAYHDVVPTWFGLYVSLETSADRIALYEPEYVPGLLQIPEYTREILAESQPDATPEAVERQVALRLERQESVLGRRPPRPVTIVLNQAVLLREVGGRATMRKQLDHVCALDAQESVKICVLPWRAGAHPSMAGKFTLLDFEDPDDPDVVYLETHVGAHYIEDPQQVGQYRRIFHRVEEQSESIREHRP